MKNLAILVTVLLVLAYIYLKLAKTSLSTHLVYRKNGFIETYHNPSPNISNNYDEGVSSMPHPRKNKHFGGFGKFGDYPMMMSCSKCNLDYDCIPFNYNTFINEKNMNVCQKCNTMSSNRSGDVYVSAKSLGGPRRCRKLNA